MSDTSTVTNTATKFKPPTMWRVILHNDDFTPFEFVIEVLCEEYNKPLDEAAALATHIHERGKAQVGIYTKEVALTKVLKTEQKAAEHEHPLLATVEPAS